METEPAIERSLITTSPSETRLLGRRLAVDAALPAVIGLAGQLGAGKTEFVKGLGWGLGLDPQAICSATFVIICEYGQQRKLIHIDAYRLAGGEELETLGFDELLTRKDCLIAIEWADRIADQLPQESLMVNLELLGPTDRRITLQAAPSSPWVQLLLMLE